MNFQSIDYIIMTAEERSISKAARLLNITQQTLSAHISSVEKELGCKLFIRHVPLEITYAGEEFLRHAVRMQKQIRSLHHTFDQITGEEKGILKIGVTHSRGKIILLPIIREFHKNYPGIELKIIESTNDILIEKLLKRDIDVCISDFANKSSGINQIDLYKERVVFVAEKNMFYGLYGPETDSIIKRIEQNQEYSLLEKCPLLMSHEEHISGQYARKLTDYFSMPPTIMVEAANVDLLLSLCVAGIGGYLCPELIVQNTLTPAELRHVYVISLGNEAEYNIRIGWRDDWHIISEFIHTASLFYSV